MRKLRLLVTMVLICAMLTGCWGSREIEHLIYVNSIGVDYVKGKFVVYTQIISFYNVAKQEAGGQRSPQSIAINKAEGETVDLAVFNLYATSQERLAWSHVKAIVFSEAALKHDVVNQVLDMIDRYYEFRYTIWTFATKDPLEDIFSAQPILNISVLYSQLNNPNDIYKQSSVIAPMYLYKFIWKWKENGQTMLLPYLSLDKKKTTQDKSPHPKVYMEGICFLQNKKLKGCLPRSQIMGLRWMDKSMQRSHLIVRDKKGEIVAILVLEKIKPKIIPQVKNGKTTFHIKVTGASVIPQYVKTTPEKKIDEWTDKAVSDEIRKTYLEGLKIHTDVLQLSDALYRKDPAQWHRLSENGELPLTPESIESIDVKVKLFTGQMAKVREH